MNWKHKRRGTNAPLYGVAKWLPYCSPSQILATLVAVVVISFEIDRLNIWKCHLLDVKNLSGTSITLAADVRGHSRWVCRCCCNHFHSIASLLAWHVHTNDLPCINIVQSNYKKLSSMRFAFCRVRACESCCFAISRWDAAICHLSHTQSLGCWVRDYAQKWWAYTTFLTVFAWYVL